MASGALALHAVPAQASQIPVDDPSNGMTFTFASGIEVTMTEAGDTHLTTAELIAQSWSPVWDGGMRQSSYFSGLGDFSTSPYTMSAIEDAQQPSWYSLTYFGDLYPFARTLGACPITAARGVEMRCARGDITFTFSEPVTDPVLHINNIGANSYSSSSEWDDQRQWVHSTSMITLDLANSVYSGTPDIELMSGVGAIDVVADGPDYLLDNTDSRLIGSPTITRTDDSYTGLATYTPGAFGAGSVKVKGTWTSITFNRDLLWVYDTYTPENRPDKVGDATFFQHQAYNECILDQLVVAGPMYRCSLTGATWAPDPSLTTRSWDSTLMRDAVEDSIQLQNPAPEGVSYLITIDEDFGTAPATYDENDGASHVVSGLSIGSSASSTGAESPAGGGLDNSGAQGVVSPNAGGSDEDDNAFEADPVLPESGDYTATIPLSGVSANAKLCGWIDVDGNGIFDAGERQCATVASGATSASLTWPAAAVSTITARTWMRLRLSNDLTGVEAPTGRVGSGEVEDWTIIPFSLAPTTTTSTTTTVADTTTTVADTTTSVTPETTVAPDTSVADPALSALPATGGDLSTDPWWAATLIGLGVVFIGFSARRRRL